MSTTSATADRAVAAAALAALTLVSGLGLHRLLHGWRWLPSVVGEALAVHAVAWLCRRWRAPDIAGALLVTLSVPVVACWLVLPHTLVAGLPLRATWTAFGSELHRAVVAIPSAAVPAPAAPDLVLAAVLATGGVAALASWSAWWLRAPLQAVVPPLSLFTCCAAFGVPADRTVWVMSEAVAVMAFIGFYDAGRWGAAPAVLRVGRPSWTSRSDVPSVRRRPRGRPARDRIAPVVAAVMIAVGVLAAAVLAPILPGYRSSPALSGGPDTAAGARVAISPMVELQGRLLSHPGLEVFTVVAAAPSYWRLTALDNFDGRMWSSSSSYGAVHSSALTAPAPGGTTGLQSESFHIDALDSVWLPTGLDPQRISGVSGVSFDPGSDSLISPRPTTNGLTYRVEVAGVSPRLSARSLAVDATPVPAGAGKDLALPTLPSSIRRLARTIVAGQRSEYGKALALERYFRRPPFVYDLRVPPGPAGTALERFLFVTHRGYCEQFAGAYAVLARAAGLPTRVAVGFTPGEQTSDGHYVVTDADAHAWPEVLFPGIGWVPFEPTPGRAIPDAAYTAASARHAAAPPAPAPTGSSVPSRQPTTTGGVAAAPAPVPLAAQAAGSPAAPPGGGGHLGALIWILLLAAGGSLSLGSTLLLRRRRARRDARRRPLPATDAWSEVLGLLAASGLVRHRDETNLELARRAARRFPHAEADLLALAWVVTAEEFGSAPTAENPAECAEVSGRIVEILRSPARTPA